MRKIKSKNQISGSKKSGEEYNVISNDIKNYLSKYIDTSGIIKISIYEHFSNSFIKEDNILLEIKSEYEVVYALDDTLNTIQRKLNEFYSYVMKYDFFLNEIYILWK